MKKLISILLFLCITFNLYAEDLLKECEHRICIDADDIRAFLVRKDDNSGDVFLVDTINSDVGILGKLWFTQVDENEFIDSLTDGYLDYRATIGHRFGDGTNESMFADNGILTMAGTARVIIAETITVGTLRAGGVAPTSALINTFPVLQFSQAVTQSAYSVWHLPENWASGTDVVFHVHWAPVNGNAGDVVWDLDWVALQDNSNEVLTAASTNVTVTDSTQSLQDELLVAPNLTISGGSLDVGNSIGFCISRDTADGNDTYGSAASFVLLHIEYTANKLGRAS